MNRQTSNYELNLSELNKNIEFTISSNSELPINIIPEYFIKRIDYQIDNLPYSIDGDELLYLKINGDTPRNRLIYLLAKREFNSRKLTKKDLY